MNRLLLIVALSFACLPSVSAQDTSSDALHDVLRVTKVQSIFEAVPARFISEFEEASGATAPSEVSHLVDIYFADSTLYRYVVEEMGDRETTTVVSDLLEWLMSDWATAARAAVDDYEPDQSVQEFAAGLRSNPPRQDRVRLVARFVQANDAGRYFVELAEARRDAIRAVAVELGDADLAALAEPSDSEKTEMEERYRRGVLVSFLQRHEPLSDGELQRLTSAYESESGRWYVQTYIEAVAEAIRRAGRELAAAL